MKQIYLEDGYKSDYESRKDKDKWLNIAIGFFVGIIFTLIILVI